MKTLIVKLVNKYLELKNRVHFWRLKRFESNFHKRMKRLGVSLVAGKDPNNPENIFLEFVKTEELKNVKEAIKNSVLSNEGDKITAV